MAYRARNSDTSGIRAQWQQWKVMSATKSVGDNPGCIYRGNLLHPRSYLGAHALLYFYFASMCTTSPLTAPTGLTPAVATISILSSYILIRFTLPDLPISSHFLTHIQPLPTDSS
jgi:hypothetical protein